MKRVKVYVLINPINCNVFYVGLTKNKLTTRLAQHICTNVENKVKENRKINIINGLTDAGLKPIIQQIDEVPFERASFFEKKYIKYYRELGFDLHQSDVTDYTKTFSSSAFNNNRELVKMYMDNDLIKQYNERAKKENRTLSNMVIFALKEYIKNN